MSKKGQDWGRGRARGLTRRQFLAESGSIVRLEKGERLFAFGDRSDAAFSLFTSP